MQKITKISKKEQENTSLEIGTKLWHIDEPNHAFEIVKNTKSCDYAILPHPSFHKSITVRNVDFELHSARRTIFKTKNEMLDARIKRIKRKLELELKAQERA